MVIGWNADRRPAKARAISASLALFLTASPAIALAVQPQAVQSGKTEIPAEVAADASGAEKPEQPKHRYSVDDMLKLETIGNAKSDPTGRWLVWEQAPPYDKLKDYSLEMYSFGNTGLQLMALDTSVPDAVPKLLFTDDGADSHWLDSFSPDGRYLVYYRSDNGAFSMGCYDFKTGKTTTFDGAPPVHPFAGHRSVWVSENEFVFSAFPEGEQPYSAMRRVTGKALWRDWNTAWSGGLSVNEVSSHAGASEAQPLGGRLFKANAATGRSVLLADGLFNSLTVSHDGRFLAGLRQFKKVQPSPGVGDQDWVTTRSKLMLFDLDRGGEAIEVAPDKDIFARSLEWAIDRDRLAFFGWDVGAGAQSGTFQALDPVSMRISPLPHKGLDIVSERERGMFQQPERAVWIGDRLAVLARPNGAPDTPPKFTYRGSTGTASGATASRADWFLIDASGRYQNLSGDLADAPGHVPIGADGKSMTVLAGGKVWQLSPGGKPRQLASTAAGAVEYTAKQRFETDRAPFSRDVMLRLVGKHGDAALALDLANDRSAVTPFPSASAQFMAITPDKGVALFTTTGPDGMSIAARRPQSAPRELLKLNAHLGAVEQTRSSVLSYTVDTPSGVRKVGACMILPAGYEKGRRYPVIVEIYPRVDEAGCTDPDVASYSGLGTSGSYDLHLLAARGYIVLKPNTSGFLTNRPPNPLGGMADAVGASLDALVAQGYADPDRIGLMGMSQGGYSSLWLATQMKRFKAVVSINGWSNMYSHRFDGTFIRRYFADQFPFRGETMRYEASGENSDFGTGVTVYQRPDVYVENSPLTHAPDISAPVMFIHSDFDFFNLNQYDMMFTALYEMKKEARYLRYAGEGHSPSSPANIRHMWTSIFDWFDRYLAPAAK